MSEVVSALDISKFYYIAKWVKYMDLAQTSRCHTCNNELEHSHGFQISAWQFSWFS